MKNFIGIDICEKSLDVFLHPLKTYKQFENTKQGIAKLCEYLKDFEIEQIAMEATGNLEVDCAKRLIESGYKVSVVNPAQVCYFRRSLGRKNKTDMVDAEIIAKFCEVMKPVLSSNASEEQEKLHYLSARRQQLITIKVAENNRLRRVKDEDCKKDIIQTIDILKKKIIKFEQLMLSIIKKNKELLRKYDILNSVPGVGKILALSLICNYSELGTLNQKQAASLGGVIPLNQMSGAMF